MQSFYYSIKSEETIEEIPKLEIIKNQGTENLIKTNVIHDSLLLARFLIW